MTTLKILCSDEKGVAACLKFKYQRKLEIKQHICEVESLSLNEIVYQRLK